MTTITTIHVATCRHLSVKTCDAGIEEKKQASKVELRAPFPPLRYMILGLNAGGGSVAAQIVGYLYNIKTKLSKEQFFKKFPESQ